MVCLVSRLFERTRLTSPKRAWHVQITEILPKTTES
jgi:hypothetical protein